jgi:hypothetical protein
VLLLGAACAVVAIAMAYVKLFVAHHSQIVMGNYWIQNTLHWYSFQLHTVGVFAFGKLGRIILVVTVVAVAACRLWASRLASPDNPIALPRFPMEPVTALVLGVPVLMLVEAISSSFLVAPNFSARYLLLCAPFLWGFCARLYDALQVEAPRVLRSVAKIALAGAVVAMATIVTNRFEPGDEPMLWNEPFRQSADWIRSLPECHDQIVPAFVTDQRAWYKPGYAEDIYENAYNRYLHGYAKPVLAYVEEVTSDTLPADLKQELQHRIDGQGCPVLAWSIHYPPEMGPFTERLLQILDRTSAAGRVHLKTFRDGFEGFALYVGR